jgi:hypothetical protein
MVLKLSEAPTLATTAQVLSPLKNVVASLVPAVPSLSTGTVPDARLVALRLVRFTPLAAGNVAGSAVKLAPLIAGRANGKRASGIVPLLRFEAFRLVKFDPLTAGRTAGNLASGIVPLPRFAAFRAVILAPFPLNDVAVSNPASLIVAVLVLILVPLVPLYLTTALLVYPPKTELTSPVPPPLGPGGPSGPAGPTSVAVVCSVLSGNLIDPPSSKLGVIVMGLLLLVSIVSLTIVILPVVAIDVNVTVSVGAFVVITIPGPADNVRVSVTVSATTSFCPATATVVKLGAVDRSNPLPIRFHTVPVHLQDFCPSVYI